eukprot:2356692-Ditylum_brightwellii.AAC.1
MDAFGVTILGNTNLQHFNTVQLYLGVVTLSDITNDEGTAIMAWTLSGEKQGQPAIPWPNQEKPSPTSWRIWRRYLKAHFSTTSSKQHCLNKPMGQPFKSTAKSLADQHYMQHPNNT